VTCKVIQLVAAPPGWRALIRSGPLGIEERIKAAADGGIADLCWEVPIPCFALVLEEEGTEDEWRRIEPVLVSEGNHLASPEDRGDGDQDDVLLLLAPGDRTDDDWVRSRVIDGVTQREIVMTIPDGSAFIIGAGDEVYRGEPDGNGERMCSRGRWLIGPR